METDDLIEIWKQETRSPSGQELEDIFRLSLKSISSKLQRKLWTDILLAVAVTVFLIATTYLSGLKYWLEASAWMTGFLVIMVVLFTMHRRLLHRPVRHNQPVQEMLNHSAKFLYRLTWTCRIIFPAFCIVLYSWITLKYGLTSLVHLAWIVPVSVLLTELLLRLIYGNTIRWVNLLQDQMKDQ